MESTTESKGLFEKLYAAGKDIIDACNKPLVKKALKRSLQSAHDDATKKIDAANRELAKARQDFDKYDINLIIEKKLAINKATEIQAIVTDEYKEMFAKDIPLNDD